MPVATVTIDMVGRKEGKQFGYIKDKVLGFVGKIKPEDLGLFSKGSQYQIEYTEKGEYKDFVRIVAKANGAAAPNGSHNLDNAKSIFITGVVGRAMQGGQFQVSDIAALTHAAASAFDREMAGK